MDIVIIEDEIETAMDLQDAIARLLPKAINITLIDSVETGIEWFRENPDPAIIFSDIQLGDGLAFEIFKDRDLSCPVIFCTAYDNHAIEAFKNNGLDYLLKPVDDLLLKQSLDKIDMFRTSSEKMHQAANLGQVINEIVKNGTSYQTTFLVSYRQKIIPINISAILLFRIADDGVKLRARDDIEYPVNYTLDELESKVSPTDFFRANRQYLIAYTAIKEIENYFERKLLIKLNQPVPFEIIISKAKAASFLRWLEDH